MIKETKEQFAHRISNAERCSYEWLMNQFDEFFNSNVVIPRGESRHPYADVLHAYAEGTPTQWNPYGMEWVDIDKDALLVPHRIKPSEPDVVPKYKSGDKVTVTSNGDTFDTMITAVRDGKYFFNQELHLSIERQDAQMKLAEPIYEWQWVSLKKSTMGLTSWVDTCRWMTDEELNTLPKNTEEYTFVKIEETKRVRQ